MPPNEIVISPLVASHFNAVAVLEHALHADAWQASALFELQQNRLLGFGGLTAHHHGRLVGYVLWQCVDTAELLRLGVATSHQRQGLASTLLKRWLQDITCHALLEVQTDNTAAIALYQKMGFTIIHTRANYYRINNAYYDAYVMQKTIT